jgi:transcriptional regulator with XRE-family HTH domain
MTSKRLNQTQLARASGLSPSRISDYINMRVIPTTFAIVNLANAFEIPVDDLVDFGERVSEEELYL